MTDALARFDAVLEVPWEALEYERWVAEDSRAHDDYLYAESKARFEALDRDRLRAPADLEVVEHKGDIRVTSKRLGGGVSVRGAKRAALERVLALVDGTRTLAELRVAAGSDRPAFEKLLDVALGSVLFVPEAVSELERAVSGVELVRFVGAPYELVRAYWTNMAAVRRVASETLSAVTSAESCVRWLRRLHVLALMGEDLRSFYRPASRITRRGVQPGRLYETLSQIVNTPERALILEGPRVGVSTTGGAQYHRLVYESAGDADAMSTARTPREVDGAIWGGVVTGRSVDEREDVAWFVPPRPLEPAHWASLFGALREAYSAAEAGRPEEAKAALARFHYRFVRMHPFRCANQSLAMNVVNLVLTRALGAGIPHLLLDQFALRLNERAYTRVFELATRTHAVPGPPEPRWAVLRERKQRAYALIQRLQSAKSEGEAIEFVRADPEAASYALIHA